MSIDHISSAAPDAAPEYHAHEIPDPVRQPIEPPSSGKKKLAFAALGAFVLFLVLVFLVVKFAREKMHAFNEDRAATQAEKKAKSSGSASSRQAIDFSNLTAGPKNTAKPTPAPAAPVPLADGKGQTANTTATPPPPRPSMMSDIAFIGAQPVAANAGLPPRPEPPKPPISPQELIAMLNQSRAPAASNAPAAPATGGALPRARSVQEVAERTRNPSLTTTKQVSAANLGDRRYVITRGHHIPCVLESEILTNLPGSVECIVTENIYGTDGKVLLLEKGTRAVGQYVTGLKTGDVRLAVVWDRVETPTGVVIDLDAHSADTVGASGVPGFVDNHWPERIGAAVLLSFFQDFVNFETVKSTPAGTGGATTFTPSSTTGTGKDLASKILDSTINIPPTLIKHRGDLITMEVRHDMWFQDVYSVR